MYVVRRAFRNYGQMMIPGSVVEPGSVKRFKSRLNDGHIINIHENDIDKWDEYFKARFGVPIVVPVVTDTTEDSVTAESTAVQKDVTVPSAKPVVKVTLK